MKTTAIVIAVVVVLAGGVYLLTRLALPPSVPTPVASGPSLPTAATTSTAAQITPSDAPGYNIYTSESGTFTFTFPTNFHIAATQPGQMDWSAQATTSGVIRAKLLVPQSYALGTNFGDATFTVGTSVDPSAVATCLTTPSGKGGPTPVTLGSTPFTKLSYSDAAAGNRYDTTSYRIVRDGHCYAVEYTIHYGNIQNYPPGSTKEFNEAALATALDEVAKSFAFLK